MAITCNFKQKVGEVTVVDRFDDKEYIHPLFAGNCMMVECFSYVGENGETWYHLENFVIDKYHAKNMLGLNKKDHKIDNIWDGQYRKFRLDGRVKENRDLAKLLIDATWTKPVTIELYYEEENANG